MNTVLSIRAAGAPPARELAGLGIVWGWAVLGGLLGAWTCFAALPGLNWPLWTVTVTAGYALIRIRVRTRLVSVPEALRRDAAAPALLVACLLSGAAGITASPHADALIFLAVASLCLYAVLATIRPAHGIDPAALAAAPLAVGRRVLIEAASRAADGFTIARMPSAVPLVRGTALALLVAMVLFLLLSAADPTLTSWRDAAWSAIAGWTFVARDVFFLLLTTLLLGAYGLAARTARDAQAGAPEIDRAPAANDRATGAVPHAPETVNARFADLERLLVLGAALALFALFFAVGLSHRLGSPSLHLAPGETLAEATHRGFGEMIVAAAVSALAIIMLEQHALRGRREPLVRVAGWAVIAASLLVVASAFARVRFYEAAYGYTEQRLYVQACCAGVASALLLLAWELRRSIDLPRLMRRVVLAAVACIAMLAYWNTGAWIVRANVARYERTGRLDAAYLARLARDSPDAVPAVIGATPRLAPADGERIRETLRRTTHPQSARERSAYAREAAWYEWSLRRAAARSALREAGLLPALTAR